ncbi:Amidase [Thermaerobacter marianensis DSM 12885]|uniref:Amidase n=1 Tax=Thermaerobacter marianensis (strain ATCC 700841 / DSM 12885 / JCM 10246 / 7p75a) TaxID=644966 RepID=E6SGY1_THEM7|nr:Asp-tRNA(Asn)/Glu-tRNA(Gln) amidotransferase GatCAB subunit A [Thermaerobacter marianensis]ADU50612.1 Amidase [Thermaerobacter marianensis DSM 12885]
MEELVRAMAAQLLRREAADDGVIREAAARLEGIVNRLRAFAEEVMGDQLPAFAFDPGHPAYRAAPSLPVENLQQLGATGGTGYGAALPARPAEAARGPRPASREVKAATWAAPGRRAMARGPLAGLTAGELVEAFHAGRLGVEEVTRAVLEQIEALEPHLNAFVTVMAERALATARRRDEELVRWRRNGGGGGTSAAAGLGPLFGVPVALKDLIDVAGVPTTAGSRVRAGHVADRTATVVRRLEEAGAVIVGKTATHEFAFGATTDTPFHGPVHNPWNLDHSAGGSSGGSGAVVGAGLLPVALGTDTGGSIRIPAAACGTVGLKPTYGRVSRHGTVPLSWSLDHTGPLAASVADAARVLEVLAGPDPLDPAAVPVPAQGLLEAAAAGAAGDLRGLRVGVLADWARDRVHPEVEQAFRDALRQLEALGAELVEIGGPGGDGPAFPAAGVLTLVNRVLALAEGGAYHAATLARQAGDYSHEVRIRFELGQFLLARDYLLAQRLRAELARQATAVMEHCHVLVAPTLPIPAPRLGQPVWEPAGADPEPVPEAMIRLTAPFNVTGQPALSVPVAVGASGLPIGVQIVGRVFDEATVLRVGAALEQVRGPLRR